MLSMVYFRMRTVTTLPALTCVTHPVRFNKPFTKEGCTLFVKLEQFQKDDTKQVVLRPEDQQWRDGIGNLKVVSLHTHNTENTALVHWSKNESFQQHTHFGGEEVIVLKGKFIDEHGEISKRQLDTQPAYEQTLSTRRRRNVDNGESGTFVIDDCNTTSSTAYYV